MLQAALGLAPGLAPGVVEVRVRQVTASVHLSGRPSRDQPLTVMNIFPAVFLLADLIFVQLKLVSLSKLRFPESITEATNRTFLIETGTILDFYVLIMFLIPSLKS